MITTEQGKTNIRGVEHYYEWIRLSSSSPKPVMVFIHGWGGSCRYWRSTAGAIAPNYDCLLYDLRGFGQSGKSIGDIGYELEDYAEDLKILLEKFNLEKVYLNAHSMGASIGGILINLIPEKIEKVILTCSGIFSYNALAFSAFHLVSSYVVKFRYNWLLQVPFAEQLFMSRFLYQPIPKSMSVAFLEDFLLADYHAALNTIYSSVSKKAVDVMPQELKKIKVPTLLISGQKDQIIPAETGKKASLLNPKYISYQEIAKTGHFPMLEDADNYLKVINKFLNS